MALSQQVAPGATDGVAFTYFDQVVINDLGHTAFHAYVQYPDQNHTQDNGIWAERAGGLGIVMRAGTPPPDVEPGVQVGFFDSGSFLYSDGDRISVQAILSGSGISTANSAGIWSEGTGPLSLLARFGSAAPGTDPGTNYYGTVPGGFESVVLNNQGRSSFIAETIGPGSNPVYGHGIWSGTAGDVQPVALSGTPAVGLSAGFNYAFFENVAINNSGEVAFGGAGVMGMSPTATFNFGIWSEGGGTLHAVARQGGAAPGVDPALHFSSLALGGFNDAGQTAFSGVLNGPGVDNSNAAGLWSGGGGTLHLVARGGDAAPGTTAVFHDFGNPKINGTGQTTFLADLTGSGVDATNDSSIWSEGGGSLHMIAREGAHAPGTEAGVKFADLHGTDTDFIDVDPVMNGAGNTAFWAYLTGPGVNTANDRGIWAEGPDGLELIAREGDPFQVAPGDTRIVSRVTLSGASGNEDGGPIAFNDHGQLAFSASFTDGSSGAFVANVAGIPEPPGLWLMLFGVLALGGSGAVCRMWR